jgi:MFS-type transporter involved in bile tolerance (Atg22 family)
LEQPGLPATPWCSPAFSALLIPPVADRILHVKMALWLCLIPAVALIQPFIWAGSLNDAYLYGSLMGFFQFPSLAISLTLLARSTAKEYSGLTAGLYWMIGNIGVFALSYLVDLIHKLSGWHVAVHCVTALLALVILIVAFLRIPPGTVEVPASSFQDCDGAVVTID